LAFDYFDIQSGKPNPDRMLKNYLKTALRNIQRRRLYSFINIMGLSTGMAFCLLILLFVKDEFSFDNFHTNRDRIYRVHKIDYKNDQPEPDSKYIILSLPLPEALKSEFGQIEYATHYRFGDANVGHEGTTYKERIHYVSKDFNRMFTMDYVAGDPSTALNDLKNVVISTSAAKKFFGPADPIGKTLAVWPIGNTVASRRDSSDVEYSVTGVFEDLPGNSSLNCEILLRIENHPSYRKEKDEWRSYSPRCSFSFFLKPVPQI
jgi:putative ABC transport system permease protein